MIGILGGGQLGRMLALAAARLGYRCHVYCPDPDSPAFDVCHSRTCADYHDLDGLEKFAADVDVVTFEFENVPVDSAFHLERHVPVRPSSGALYMAQDRRNEKIFLTDREIPAAPFAAVDSPLAIAPTLRKIGTDGILKTRRFGYDGKGQTRIAIDGDPEQAWSEIGEARAVLEGVVPFSSEISVVAARGMDGMVRCYCPVWNVHRNHILHTTTAPAPISSDLATAAVRLSHKILTDLDYVGVMGVEMFIVGDGLVINEMAPRVHNSGHWTMDGAATDQFEQHIRAICGLPLGSPDMLFDHVDMTNLIGDDAASLPEMADEPGAKIHLYGKREIRAGRKMGHINRIGTNSKK